MAWSRKLECSCGHAWSEIVMKRTEPKPACPECGARSTEGLAAPGIGRGAAPETGMKVPLNKTQAIDMAQRIITEDSHVTNMKSSVKTGEDAAVPIRPVKEPVWHNTPTMAQVSASASIKNTGFLDKMSDRRQSHMKPVYREQK